MAIGLCARRLSPQSDVIHHPKTTLAILLSIRSLEFVEIIVDNFVTIDCQRLAGNSSSASTYPIPVGLYRHIDDPWS
jgi:hypothetical protein